ncbi:glycoside hydrolase family 55 protein [Piloderma croceum F 1598]|uniref:Glycoside hydrolase family 55 protein n=1 Tax=Piloderma croceum (strain F 1598) TaxID=765440 RepID=A0A0C3GA95_PILCF|nr:glycoside hydrolase family 55 protein [Piloderma croceum F 1598]
MLSDLALLIMSMVTVLGLAPTVSGLGSSCSKPLGAGTSAPSDPFWMESIKHQGTSPFNPRPSSYKVFRNVKDFGAKGDGKTDDTAAINLAISSGNRCGGGTCQSSTVTPAVVYFPTGKYLVSSPLVAYYYTQIIGDAKRPPTLLASSGFTGAAVIDADPYIPGGNGSQWYINQDNFYRSVRNFVIDLRGMPASTVATGLHWQVSQATSLKNIVVEMSTASGNNHQGLFMEDGSGGFMGDIVFNGGMYGMSVGNQQFTVRNITVNNANTAIHAVWNWGWTFQGVKINQCQVGFDLTTGGTTSATQTVGAEAIIDAVITDTPIFIRNSNATHGALAGSLVLNNIQLSNVPIAVGVLNGTTVLAGGHTTIHSWGQGNVYSGTSSKAKFTQGTIPSVAKPKSLIDGAGKIFQKSHPQYEDYSIHQFVSVKDQGAKGDGKTDDTKALNMIMEKYSGCKIIYFDAGTYIVTDTLKIPAGTRVVGEAWSVIAGKGNRFSDQTNPRAVVQVGEECSQGIMEISDIIFSTVGPAAGAVVVEWNVKESSQGEAGTWDSHIRLGGADGTNLQPAHCKAGTVSEQCMAAFLALHLTKGSTGYFEGLWAWLADHDLDGDGTTQLSLFSGRGILSESQGPVWMIGTASEHHVMYQYSLVGAQDHYMGLIQTETPYYQPVPLPPSPFKSNSKYNDPTFGSHVKAAWGLHVRKSSDITVFGAGLYDFFQNYNQTCLSTTSCQSQILDVDSESTIQIYSLSTVGTTYQLSVNGKGIIKQSDNADGYQETATVWTPASSSHQHPKRFQRRYLK